MADKSTNNLGLGEISTIRNILMGEHISQYEASFNKLDGKLDDFRVAFDEKIAALQKDYDNRLAEMKTNYEAKISKLEASLKEKEQALSEKIQTTSSDEKKRLSGLFASLSEQVAKG